MFRSPQLTRTVLLDSSATPSYNGGLHPLDARLPERLFAASDSDGLSAGGGGPGAVLLPLERLLPGTPLAGDSLSSPFIAAHAWMPWQLPPIHPLHSCTHIDPLWRCTPIDPLSASVSKASPSGYIPGSCAHVRGHLWQISDPKQVCTRIPLQAAHACTTCIGTPCRGAHTNTHAHAHTHTH